MASLKKLQNLFLSIWVLLSVSTLQGCAPSAQPMAPPAAPAMPVELGTAREQILDDASTFVATLKSRKSVNLKPQIEGRVLEIRVKSGDAVSNGQALMVLDKSKQEALVNNSEAEIESAIADETNAHAMLKSLKATRLSKVGNLDFASMQFKRYKTLNADGAVSSESADEKRNNLTITQAELGAVDAQISAQEAQISRAQKQIKVARAEKQEQVEQLKYFTVKAPFAGLIGDVPVRIGDFVTTETTLTTVDQTRPLEVYLNIPTSESQKLTIGLVADIVDDTGKSIEAGKISFISSQVDPTQQTVLTKADLPNVAARLRSGQTVNCRVVWGRTTAVTIPVTSVSRFSGQDFVYVAKKGTDGKMVASQRAVKLGPIKGNEYRVISGVKPGEQIVTSGIQNLADGVPIQPSS
ncbi:MAG: efflux RND transporter periplasmic adaptor subunit [Candidatus Melainabacteria bacterium]|nr:efflux RND transporter periplasmic adaptor subunit [Candidatus Melainabacteria bacterium]